jgi:hypothetical protein
MAGFGAQPLGTSPFGVGTPASAVEPPDGPSGSRFINPVTLDYEVDGTTRQFKQMPPTRQRVFVAVMTRFNSSAIPGFGTRLPARMGDAFESQVRNEINRALRHMVEVEKSLLVLGIKVERGMGGRARITISFRDLVAGETDSVSV